MIKQIFLWLGVPLIIYFGIPVPFKIAIIFTYIAVLIAHTTPKGSPYKLINALLMAEFLLVTGIDIVIFNSTDKVMTASQILEFNEHFELYKLLFNVLFYCVFFYSGAILLSTLACAMTLYHSARAFSYLIDAPLIFEYDYEMVIWIFCLLQLACGFRGMLHGLEYRNYLSHSRHNHSHSGVS